jgi:hypothetical protein
MWGRREEAETSRWRYYHQAKTLLDLIPEPSLYPSSASSYLQTPAAKAIRTNRMPHIRGRLDHVGSWFAGFFVFAARPNREVKKGWQLRSSLQWGRSVGSRIGSGWLIEASNRLRCIRRTQDDEGLGDLLEAKGLSQGYR